MSIYNLCICGHEDNRHEDIDDGTVIGNWGVGKCELCRCSRFEQTKEFQMSLPINTLEGITKRVNALRQLIRETACNLDTAIHNRARDRLLYWEMELNELERKMADEYIDNILDGLE